MVKSFDKLSISELKNIRKLQKQKLDKEFNEYKKQKINNDNKKKQKLIADIKKIKNVREKIKSKIKDEKKVKSFDDYFEECIKNKKIPPDTPDCPRKALERAIREYNQGITKEKPALSEFANKFIIKGETDITPFAYFKFIKEPLKEFLRNRRNIKVRFVLVCVMEQKLRNKKLDTIVQDKSFFNSDTYINIEATNVKKLLVKVIYAILNKIKYYQLNGSGWYFKEVIQFEIHTVDYNPRRGSSHFPLPDWIKRKRAIIYIRNTDNKCFLWCVLRYLNPISKNDDRFYDLSSYNRMPYS